MFYGGRDRLPGEEYVMDDREHSEINVLCLLNKIERVTDAQVAAAAPVSPVTAPTYQTAAGEPEREQDEKEREGEEGPAEGETQPPRRPTYRRRDMRPEQ